MTRFFVDELERLEQEQYDYDREEMGLVVPAEEAEDSINGRA